MNNKATTDVKIRATKEIRHAAHHYKEITTF